MQNPFTEYFIQFQNNPTLTKQSSRSNCQTFMLNTKTTPVPTLSRSPLVTLILAKTLSLSSYNNNPFQMVTNLKATASPYQTSYQSHTAPNKGLSASLSFLSSVPTVNPITYSPVTTHNSIVLFAATNKSVKIFDGLEHLYKPEGKLHQIESRSIFTMGEQTRDLIVQTQQLKRKKTHKPCCLSRTAVSCFFRLLGSYKSDRLAFVFAFKKQISSRKTTYYLQVEANFLS